jgi:hypothetical protein
MDYLFMNRLQEYCPGRIEAFGESGSGSRPSFLMTKKNKTAVKIKKKILLYLL